jgi:hypothetical protein
MREETDIPGNAALRASGQWSAKKRGLKRLWRNWRKKHQPHSESKMCHERLERLQFPEQSTTKNQESGLASRNLEKPRSIEFNDARGERASE